MATKPTLEETKEAGPAQSGTMTAFLPEWRRSGTWGPVVNKRLGYEGGEDWTSVPVTVFRGGIAIMLPDGREIQTGIPFPRIVPGILETIHLFGFEQANALAWCFAAQAAAVGANVEIRVKEYRLDYSIKTEVLSNSAPLVETCQ